MNYERLKNVSFRVKLKDRNNVQVHYATIDGKMLLALYYFTIDVAEPVLFDIRKAVDAKQKDALAQELADTGTNKRLRVAIVQRVVADVSTDFILKNQTEQTA